ncbi:hypothetical protein EDF48_102147 [Curtobacterium sp. PhB191]|uniref:hypothetical protein n=1 Tax=Curtobacterium sp. PhB191 TaxID=2485202 RepID=UPI00104DF39C|nr:hypothetical protein [Curtobacterium sp. PhB191]TCU86486.1 hypothetical protein EDF48_102147 [Curtobacterium sp. PhB191]
MSYAVEHGNNRDGQADGPYRTGVYNTVAEAKAAGDRLAAKDGLANIVVRDEGDKVSIFAGNVVSELFDGEWHDRGAFDVQNWWPKLDERSRTWLLEHAEERIPTELLHRVIAAGGIVPGTSWEGQDYEFRLPEAAVAWITSQR